MQQNKYAQTVVEQVKKDFLKRQQERKNYERQWQLNLNFLMGNQYSGINALGDIEEFSKQYFWQEREVFNHIAPIMEARICKLSTIKPTINVVPSSSSNSDINTAKVSGNILKSVQTKLKISEKISQAIHLSEIFGTSFYKIVWNNNKGLTIGFDSDKKEIKEGEVDISVVPPYEIYPDSCETMDIANLSSIIHAKVVNVNTIKAMYNQDVKPEDVDVMNFGNDVLLGGFGYNASIKKIVSQKAENSALVIEKYEKPSVNNPNGKLTIVAGDKLLFEGELPLINGEDGKRIVPFIKQCSIMSPNCFWGQSLIERLIPIQRSYNAVKNRKHEFLNRMALGILTVEDGSVDVDNLEDEGLCPGKVLVYRQGATPPKIMDYANMPTDFAEEEDKLLNEFTIISGMSDMLLNNEVTNKNLSGTALGIISEQESTRLTTALNQIEFAIKEIGNMILRLYKQFVKANRLCKIAELDGKIEIFYWNSSNISADDIIIETKAELGESLSQKREMIFRLLDNGLLKDSNGNMSNRMRIKTLEMLGFGTWENRNDLTEMHINRATKENLKIMNNQEVEVMEIDDHKLHIDEHIAFMISDEFEKFKSEKAMNKLLNHINIHKSLLQKESEINDNKSQQV